MHNAEHMEDDHRVYVTHGTEYHLRDSVCLVVRDRRSGAWITDHDAVFQEATCMLLPTRRGVRRTALGKRIGARLCFETHVYRIVTSEVRQVRAPTDEERAAYLDLDYTTRPSISLEERASRPPLAQLPERTDETGRFGTHDPNDDHDPRTS